MSEGTYYVNKSARKDSSLQSIICALLVFLAFCIAISLLLLLFKKTYSAVETATENPDTTGNGNFAAHMGKESEKTTLGYDKQEVTRSEAIPTNKSPSVTVLRTVLPTTTLQNTYEEDHSTPRGNEIYNATYVTNTENSSCRPEIKRENPVIEKSNATEENDTTLSVEEGRNGSDLFTTDIEHSTPIPTTSNATDNILKFGSTPEVYLGIDHNIFHDGSSTEEIENDNATVVPDTIEVLFEDVNKVNSSALNSQRNNTDVDAGESTNVPDTTAGMIRNPQVTTPKVFQTATQNFLFRPATQRALLISVDTTTGSLPTTEVYSTNSNSTSDTGKSATGASLLGSYITPNPNNSRSSVDTYTASEASLPEITTISSTEVNNANTVATGPPTTVSLLRFINMSSSNVTKNSGTVTDAYTTPGLHGAGTTQIPSSTEVNSPQSNTNVRVSLPSTTVANLVRPITTRNSPTIIASTTVIPPATKTANTSATANPLVKKQRTTCTSATCKKTVSDMLSMMNHNVDPCDNFYKFACGSQEAERESLEEAENEVLLSYLRGIGKTSDHYLQVFQKFYENCVEYENTFQFTERIQLMGDFPNLTLTELFVELVLTQSMPLFDIGLDINQDLNKYYLQWKSPTETTALKSNVQDWTILEQIRTFCVNEQKRLTIGSTIDLNMVHERYRYCQKERFESVATNFVDVMKTFFPNHSIYNEENLQKLTSLVALSQNYSVKFEPKKQAYDQSNKLISDLNDAYSLVDWKIFLQNITFNSTFAESDEIEVNADYYFYKILNVLNGSYTESEVQNMLQLYAKLQLWENTVIPKQRENRELYCLDLCKELMPDIVSSIVYDRVKSERTFVANTIRIRNLFDNLKKQLNESFEKSELDDQAKKILQNKLHRTRLSHISTGDYSTLKAHYSRITISHDNYQENVIQLLKNYKTIIYSLERRMVNPATLLRYFVDFSYRPFKSFHRSDDIVFHPAIFNGIHMQLPEHIFLAKTGMNLGKELAKRFDLLGRYFLSDPHKTSINDFYDNLKMQSGNLLLFYANNTYNLQDKTVNFEVESDALINEIISDNAAFRLVHDSVNFATQMELPWVLGTFPVDKVFYIAAAQEHCKKASVLDFMMDIYVNKELPPPLKIQNVISNSKGFSAAFECPEGSSMVIDDELISQFPHIRVSDNDAYNMNYN